MPGGRLIIICGLPGSGKTTLARQLAEQPDVVRYSPDEWMDDLALDLYDEPRRAAIETLQWQQAQHVLTLGGTAVIEWGTWARSERDTLRQGARALGAAAELVFLDAPADELFRRIALRDAETPPITRDMVDSWLEALERPTAEELSLFDPPEGPTPA
ncbi:hypothetical protein GCM10007989_02430 [Devosia pacifica]|uniref:ATP-binding protein n=1 Tax=Devosia pacifica TaxID=1335967 RepID=A0A918VLS8_9HYPH|nr:ATP-binding protein [Devosia pacifica]GHA11628.1 hypothetical protein GCM10007989_02430 [Devosia pacifica]